MICFAGPLLSRPLRCIADVQRAFACDRSDDCQGLVPLAELTLNDSASSRSTTAVVSTAPALPPQAHPTRRRLARPREAAAHLMARIAAEVLALLQGKPDPRLAAALTGRARSLRRGTRRCSTRRAGPSPRARCSSPRWTGQVSAQSSPTRITLHDFLAIVCLSSQDQAVLLRGSTGPLTVLAQTAPNNYRLDFTIAWRVLPGFNVERLRPYRGRPDHRDGPARARRQMAGPRTKRRSCCGSGCATAGPTCRCDGCAATRRHGGSRSTT